MRTSTVGLTASQALLSAGIGLSVVVLAACGDAPRGLAQGILRRIVPAGDTVPLMPDPIRADQSLQYTWDFETHLSAVAYADWLRVQLPDFQIDGNSSDLRFGKYEGGDAYRLHVTIEAATASTRVHVQLVALPD